MNVLQSRRFWTLIITALVDILTVMFRHYIIDPFSLDLAFKLLALANGVAGIYIVSLTVEDYAAIKNTGTTLRQLVANQKAAAAARMPYQNPGGTPPARNP